PFHAIGSKNKHAFLDPRGWSFFPRPALRETPRIPRLPSPALASFLRAGPLGLGTLAPWSLCPFADLVHTALRGIDMLSFQRFEHAFGLRGWDKPHRDWLLIT